MHFIFSGEPHLEPPSTLPIILPSFILLTCGQDITVQNFDGIFTLSLQCSIFNGTGITTRQVFKDGELISNGSFSLTLAPPNEDSFGTYAFVLSTEGCGSAIAVSRILRQG